MKISEIDETNINAYLKITDFENFFDVHEDKNDLYYFNLNSNLYLSGDKSLLPIFTCDCYCHWPLVSYKIYGSTRLVWLLWKLNDITPSNIFQMLKPGDKIKYLDSLYVDSIIADLNDFED